MILGYVKFTFSLFINYVCGSVLVNDTWPLKTLSYCPHSYTHYLTMHLFFSFYCAHIYCLVDVIHTLSMSLLFYPVRVYALALIYQLVVLYFIAVCATIPPTLNEPITCSRGLLLLAKTLFPACHAIVMHKHFISEAV